MKHGAQPHGTVVLIGMKGCGKSTLGAGLARRWGWPFHDVDALIETTHACETGVRQPVRALFAVYGAEHFRRIEGMVVCDLHRKLNAPDARAVVALGGRTALHPNVTGLLGGIGRIVYLKAPLKDLLRRLPKELPPFLDAGDPEGSFARIFRAREPVYERLAETTVEVGGLSADAALDRLARVLETHDAR